MVVRTKNTEILDRRRAGILLHPTSLPGSGDMGPDAYHFVDFLVSCGASVWQVLPLVPTHEDGSPYMGLSVMMGNPNLISLHLLHQWGWLSQADLGHHAGKIPKHHRKHCIKMSLYGFEKNATEEEKQSYEQFLNIHQQWLNDYALFVVLREEHESQSWTQWPAVYRDRDSVALKQVQNRLADAIDVVYFEQYVFFKQWLALKDYANAQGVLLFGDMPIFVAHDSAEVWANRRCFDLLPDGQSRTIAGVPPDYFSETGQLWGNPHYAWQTMREDEFSWWHERIKSSLSMFDLIRVDHFRGFEAYWQIKADAVTAIDGKWVKAPGKALFNSLLKSFGTLPLVAEDLGIITDKVTALRDKYAFPGMKILQFAFDGDDNNPYLPHNHLPNSVVYTGTHDNDTSLGWFESLNNFQRHAVYDYLGYDSEPMPWALIRAACASVSKLAVIPMQDLLEFDSKHRMNMPGVSEGNWKWSFEWDQLSPEMPAHYRRLNSLYGRNSFNT